MNRKSWRWSKLIFLGASLASAAALVAASAVRPKGRTLDMVGGTRDALAKTEEEGRWAMSGSGAAIDTSLERFRDLFKDFRAEPVAVRATELYAANAYFNDGYVELKGVPAIAAYFARSAAATASIDVDVEQITRTEDGVYVRWVMTYTIHYRKTTIVAPGISHLRFTRDGRISYHRDYWDGSGALAGIVPLTGSILNAIRERL